MIDRSARHPRIATNELDGDTSLAKIGTHGEVRDGCDHGDSGSDVVEDPVRTRLSERQPDEDECRDSHDRSDGLILLALR